MDEMAVYYTAAPPPPPPVVLHPPHHSHFHHHHQQQHNLPPPPPPPPPPVAVLHPSLHAPPPYPLSPLSPMADVRTLFVAGLPLDVKAREIYNLFRDFPGFESFNLRSASKSNQPFAFAVFVDQHSAAAAMHALNGLVFDLEKGSTLYIDFAKSNSRSKRRRIDDEGFHTDKKSRVSPGFARGSSDYGVGSFHIPGMSSSAYNTIGYSPSQSYLSYDSKGINETNLPKVSHSSGSHAPQNNPPCPTIFAANLSPNCTEQELVQVFSRCRGFLKLKIQRTYGPPVAFIDFEDTGSSSEALNQLQGVVLLSSPPGQGMRLEYAKSRMGKRRKPR